MLEWCSRTIYKGKPYSKDKKNEEYRKENLKHLNNILKTSFDENDIELIYCELGNCINHSLTVEFIESSYDMNLLKGVY